MSTVTTVKEQGNIPVGYTAQAVVARMAALDADAAGNSEKAAWKRYMSLSLLSIAKAWDKKKVIELVFGKGERASKTFQNMWALAEKARATMIGNGNWAGIKIMAIDEAQNAVLDMINRHMAVLSCTSKNEYERFCNLSPMEADDKRKVEADQNAADEAEAEQGPEGTVENKADAAPERTAAQAAISALAEAKEDDLMQVAAHVVGRLSIESMTLMRDALENMLINASRPFAVAA